MEDINQIAKGINKYLNRRPGYPSYFANHGTRDIVSLSTCVRSLAEYGPSVSNNFPESVSSAESSPCHSDSGRESGFKKRVKEFSLLEISRLIIDSSTIAEIKENQIRKDQVINFLIHGLNVNEIIKDLSTFIQMNLRIPSSSYKPKFVYYKGKKSVLYFFANINDSRTCYYGLKNYKTLKNSSETYPLIIIGKNSTPEYFGVILDNLPYEADQNYIPALVNHMTQVKTVIHYEPPFQIEQKVCSLIRTFNLEDAEHIALKLNNYDTGTTVIKAAINPSSLKKHKNFNSGPFRDFFIWRKNGTENNLKDMTMRSLNNVTIQTFNQQKQNEEPSDSLESKIAFLKKTLEAQELFNKPNLNFIKESLLYDCSRKPSEESECKKNLLNDFSKVSKDNSLASTKSSNIRYENPMANNTPILISSYLPNLEHNNSNSNFYSNTPIFTPKNDHLSISEAKKRNEYASYSDFKSESQIKQINSSEKKNSDRMKIKNTHMAVDLTDEPQAKMIISIKSFLADLSKFDVSAKKSYNVDRES